MGKKVKSSKKFSLFFVILGLGIIFSLEFNYKNLFRNQDIHTSFLTGEIRDNDLLPQSFQSLNDVFLMANYELGFIIFLFVFKFIYQTKLFFLNQSLFFESTLPPPNSFSLL